jgi:hypothetical protein
MDRSTDEEFLADFGDRGITEQELNDLLARARREGSRELRLVVKQFRALKRACGWLISDLDAAESVEVLRESESVRITRFLASDIPNSA